MAIIAALKKVIGRDSKIQKSGNLEHQLRALSDELRKELADIYFIKNKDTVEEIFSEGLELGRKAKNKIVYMVVIDKQYYYFIGTEADILRKFDKKQEELVENKEILV